MPDFPEPKLHDEAWTRAPYTQILPDHWVAIGYHGGEQVFTYEGKTSSNSSTR